MSKFYLGSLKYQKVMENGKEKKVTEKYLIDALSVTEAEARLVKEMKSFIEGEFEVKAVADTKYEEVLTSNYSEDDKWWKCKVSFITIDEKSGREKRTAFTYLVEAKDLEQAVSYLRAGLNGLVSDYVIESISYSKIEEVFFYKPKQ